MSAGDCPVSFAASKRSIGELPPSFVPSSEPDARYHAELKTLRNKVYAHTDKVGGRSAS